MVIADSRRDLGRLNQMLIGYANFLLLFNNANEDTRSSLEAAAGRIGQEQDSTRRLKLVEEMIAPRDGSENSGKARTGRARSRTSSPISIRV